MVCSDDAGRASVYSSSTPQDLVTDARDFVGEADQYENTQDNEPASDSTCVSFSQSHHTPGGGSGRMARMALYCRSLSPPGSLREHVIQVCTPVPP